MLFGSSQKYLKMNKWVTTGNIIDYHVWGDRESIGDKGRLWITNIVNSDAVVMVNKTAGVAIRTHQWDN